VVGRAAELTSMAERVARAAAGDGLQVLLVSGEPGIGKTTLVAEAARAAFAGGACVLYGQCQEELRAPYQLFAEALGHLVAHADERCLREHVAEHGPALARIVPALGSRLGSLPRTNSADADTERYLLFAAVAALLGTVARSRPLVVVLDDLQWADVGSLQLLRHLVRVGPAAGAVLLATYRAGDPSVAPAFESTLADLYRHRATSHVELAGLDDLGVARLLEAIAGEGPSAGGASLAAAVHRETDGNPFFVSEVFRHLAETGALSTDAVGHWTSGDRLELPESLRVVIKARVARLGALAGEALSLAAVVGRDFDLDVLVHASGILEDELLDVLERAGDAALVREVGDAPGRYAFAHALLQRTLYDDLCGARRVRAHRLVAEGLERLGEQGTDARLGELAWHWTAAAHTQELAGKALDYARRAGDAALAALSPDDALRHFEQARELLARAGDPDPVVAIDLAIGLGTAQHQTGDPAFGDTLLRAARQAHALGDTGRLVAALLANERDLLAADVDEEKVALLDEALAAVRAPSTERAMLLASLHRELLFAQPRERCGELALEALEIAQESHEDAAIAAVINRVSLPTPLMFERSLELSAEAVVRAERTGDPVLLFWASLRRAKIAATAADLEELDRCLARSGRLAARLCQPVLSFACTMERSGRALLVGDADLAERLVAEALGFADERGLAGTEIGSAASAMTVSWYRGCLGEVANVVEKAIAAHPGVTAFRAVLALAHAEAGDRAAAGALIEEFVGRGFELVPNPLWLIETMGYAAAAVETEEARFAEALHEQLEPWGGQFSYYNPATFGPVSHVLGGLATLLGRHDEAEASFERSARLCERMDARFFAARTDLAWAGMLARRGAAGDAGRARRLLTRARSTAIANGYARVGERAAEALAAL
jgi:tetratricopeptide (TPR) repeat protein